MTPIRSALFSILWMGCTGTKLDSDPIYEVEPSSEPAGEPSGEPATEPSGEPSGEPATEPSGEPDPNDVDNDGDGFTENEGDCLDGNSQIYPGAVETCDLVDNNCDGLVDNDPEDGTPYFLDGDGDGFGAGFGVGTTCSDAPEGHALTATDCDDSNGEVNPDGTEVCADGLDNNCDGLTDDGENWYADADADGFGAPQQSDYTCTPALGWVQDNTDCDDTDALINPSGTEVLLDGIDQDCDGVDRSHPYIGDESLQFAAEQSNAGVLDCDLAWTSLGSAANVTCLDCEFAFTVELTYDTTSLSGSACSSASQDEEYTYGYVEDYDGAGNAALMIYDETSTSWSPWLEESDVNTVIDFDGRQFTYQSGYTDYQYQGYFYTMYWQGSADIVAIDNDGDGLNSFNDCNDGDATIGSTAMDIPADGIDQDCDGADATYPDSDGDGFTSDVDCDDNDATAYPSAPEVFNDGIDQNCDGSDTIDVDNDGIDSTVDCNDNDGSIYPGAPEVANDGIDQDCDGIDYVPGVDNDGDGFDNATDCDDNDATIYPGATEIVNDGIDQDCDGTDSVVTCPTGEMGDCNGNCAPTTWLGDTYCDDGTYSHNNIPIYFICPAFTYDNGDCVYDNDGDGVDTNTDCDDGEATIYPGATEVFNDGIDQDCDGLDTIDADNDGVESTLDCDDNDATIYPGATEVQSDGIDQDCDGVDAAPGVDNDGDGFDSIADCDDTDASVYPSAAEILGDGIDQDCDGVDSTYSSFVGTESYQVTETGQSAAGVVPCDITWDLTTNTVLSPCTDCMFAFQLDFTYDASNSTVDPNGTDCPSYAVDFGYDYGLVEDYDGAGNSAIMTKQTGSNTWQLWFTNGDLVVNNGTPAVVDFSNGQFNYSIGYQDYAYQGSYFTNWAEGSATVQ